MSNDEFEKAFNEDAEASAMDQKAAAALADAIKEPENNPSSDSAEGATEAGAVAVSLDADGGGVSEERDQQRESSWEGRLKAREEELKLRAAELEAREQALAAVSQEAGLVQAKDGAEIDTGGTETAAEAPPLLEEIRNEAAAMAQDPERLNAALEVMIEDYGREQVVLILAMTTPMIELLAGPHVSRLEQRIGAVEDSAAARVQDLITQLQQAVQDMHMAAIADAHEDFEALIESEDFQAWLASLSSDDKLKAEEVMNKGSAQQIIKLLQRFKDSRKPAEKTIEDIWSEDAALGVKSGAPVKLPTKAPVSEKDEFARAWDED